MITALHHTLAKLQGSLCELEALLNDEVAQLSQARINPVSLQVISDNKSRLLSTVCFYDDERKEHERRLDLAAPYPSEPALDADWNAILQTLQRTRILNLKSAQLINIHQERIHTFKQHLTQEGEWPSLYGADGDKPEMMGIGYRVKA